jgi:hypothetical protein
MFLFGQSSSRKGMWSSFLPSFYSIWFLPLSPVSRDNDNGSFFRTFLLFVYLVHVRLISPEKGGGKGMDPNHTTSKSLVFFSFYRSMGSKGTNVAVTYVLDDCTL